jgi:hypothetical protein
MAVTEDETKDAERGFLTLSRTAHLHGSAGIVRFVAGFRSSSPEAAGLLSASAADNQLRGALGDEQDTRPARERLAIRRCT